MNPSPTRKLLPFVLLTLLWSLPLLGQVPAVRPGDLNPRLDSLFTGGHFARLEVEALRMIHAGRETPEADKIAAHLYLGFAWVLTEREADARNAFLETLALRPSLTLDDVYVPPKLFEAFENARLDFLAGRAKPASSLQQIERLPHHALGTNLNFVLPGSGFVASGYPLRGTLWGTGFLISAGGFVYTTFETVDARKRYLREVNPFRIEERYDTYNWWYNRMLLLGATTLAVYIGAQIDYQLLGASTLRAQPTLLGDAAHPTPGVNLALRW